MGSNLENTCSLLQEIQNSFNQFTSFNRSSPKSGYATKFLGVFMKKKN